MLCTSCSKLAQLHTNKVCSRCKGSVFISISVICEKCSSKTKQCSACLKNISSPSSKSGGCGQCGK